MRPGFSSPEPTWNQTLVTSGDGVVLVDDEREAVGERVDGDRDAQRGLRPESGSEKKRGGGLVYPAGHQGS